MSYNSQQKLNDNIAAIRIALEYNQRQKLSDEQVQSLRQYSGFGGLKAVLFPNAPREEWVKLNASKADLSLYADIIELHNLLQQHLNEREYKETIDSLRNSILTSFYTPVIIPKILLAELKKQGIEPKNLYEPSSGAGIFITEAVNIFPSIQTITAVEKDILSGRVLTALSSSIPVPVSVQVTGFENTSNGENEKSDLIVSNIPFGNFKVLDEQYPDENISGKIHNYFFAKGLDKIKEGGLLAYITTDAFLNSPSNREAREYLFHNANFISLAVLPDNLMKDTGNTEAPSHLLIVQKQSGKKDITTHEQNLIATTELHNEFGEYHVNRYIVLHHEIIAANEIKPGRNQYGRATETIWQKGDINGIQTKLSANIEDGLTKRFNQKSFEQDIAIKLKSVGKQLTYLPIPDNIPDNNSVQLGLFDVAPGVNISRAMAYINPLDATVVDKKTARILNIIKTTDNPEHEGILLLTAKSAAFKQYVYKLYSNFDEVQFGVNWMNAAVFQNELKVLPNILKQYGHEFYNEGEAVFHISLGTEEDDIIKDVNPYHKEATLIIHNNRVGFVSFLTGEKDKPVFLPSIYDKKDLAFYQQYTLIRDRYLLLADKELTEKVLANGKALEAYAADRKDNIPVEAKDHVKMFHHFFFTLDPDDKVIQTNITKALYLADNSAKQQYDNLKENGYFSNLIAGNISQEIQVDSIEININSYPYYFKYKGKETIIRPTSVITRSLITEGYLRNVSRSDNNPHGFLIEKWQTLENADLKTQTR